MNGKRQIKLNESGRRCGHTHCGDCQTKRGSRRGNRRVRQAVKRALRGGDRES